MAFSATIFSITILIITILIITTFSITILSIMKLSKTISKFDTQHNRQVSLCRVFLSVIMLSAVMLNVIEPTSPLSPTSGAALLEALRALTIECAEPLSFYRTILCLVGELQ
jgi:hypothetical protein